MSNEKVLTEKQNGVDDKALTLQVEAYLNGEQSGLSLNFYQPVSAFTRFHLQTIKRLERAFELFRTGKRHFQQDFLLALRDFLLTFNTDIQLHSLRIPKPNGFGLSQDSDGRCYASYQFPEYVHSTFAAKAFLSEEPQSKACSQPYDLHTDPLIYEITGFSMFKSMAQKLSLYGALNTPDGFTTLVSLPTGGGKSLITQTLAYQMPGLTIVIVPTISLAIDQVRVSKKIIHTEHPEQEIFLYRSGTNIIPILQAIQKQTARLLFISPEALTTNPRFTDVIREANKLRYLKNIVIDEAHIVVDWGASFRVDYQCLESWRRNLLSSNPAIRTILLSATYEKRCVDILRDFFSQNGKWIEIRCDSLRHEPHFMCIWNRSPSEKRKHMLELVRKMPHPMIIYVAKPDEAEDVKEALHQDGIQNVQTYTGLTTGNTREELIRLWANDQFEIMVATSAFGIGVDKPDIRTVLHLHVPQNPNAYYQELGRGGRDRLPCLSIMCIDQEDQAASFQRINKRVLTEEKIIGRWDSMYNSVTSKRVENRILIDATIKPSYNIAEDILDDAPATEADMNWNIYVLLLFRRYNMIRICEVLPNNGDYIFVIEIVNDLLRMDSVERTECIQQIRESEWNYFSDAYKLMIRAVRERGKNCWSEMFFDTYDKVSEYCVGCDLHELVVNGEHNDFALKMDVKTPERVLSEDQRACLSGGKQMICFGSKEEHAILLTKLLQLRLSAIIVLSAMDVDHFLTDSSCKQNVLILDEHGFRQLVRRHSKYYLSGLIAVVYSGTPQEIYNRLRLVDAYLIPNINTGIVHILEENTYFDWLNKTFADMVDGAVIPINTI